MRRNGLCVDSSLNSSYDYSGGTIEGMSQFESRRQIEGVTSFPVTVYRDGFGRMRPAQLNGCSYGELRSALMNAQRLGLHDFVVVSHNFEMLKPGTNDPDWIVVRRFEALCALLAEHKDIPGLHFSSIGGARCVHDSTGRIALCGPHLATTGRYLEQLIRRFR